MTQIGFHMSADESTTRRPSARTVVVVALVTLSVLAGLGLSLVRNVRASEPVWTGEGQGTVRVEIPSGASGAQIGRILTEKGVVQSADAFVDAVSADPRGDRIQPGTYDLRAQMGPTEALRLILDPASRVVDKLIIPEGLRLSQVTAAIVKATGLKQADVEAAISNASELGLPDWSGGSAEGFLFPATYEFGPDARATSIIRALIARWQKSADRLELEARAEDAGLTPYDALIVASLVQGEGAVEDYPKVARVIYNRLKEGMPLQLDATVNYALGTSDITLSADALAVDSPYNTYKVKGLTPGPINSPGDAAMEAALNPAKGDWLYFVTVNPTTGETKFTADYDEFLRFKREFQENVK